MSIRVYICPEYEKRIKSEDGLTRYMSLYITQII